MSRVNWRGAEAIHKVLEVVDGKLKDMAEYTTELAKTDHPYKNQTGTNTASITWDSEGGVFRVYTQSGYGGYLELGTSKMPPYPYILPAYEKAKEKLEDDLEDSI